MSPAETFVLALAFFGGVGMWWWGHPPTNSRLSRLERRVRELERK
jgi:hypothetical protein